jgi:hypothetical protein
MCVQSYPTRRGGGRGEGSSGEDMHILTSLTSYPQEARGERVWSTLHIGTSTRILAHQSKCSVVGIFLCVLPRPLPAHLLGPWPHETTYMLRY